MIEIDTIDEFEGGDFPIWFIARGFVDKDEFIAALKEQYGYEIEQKMVEHVYVRNVPVGRGDPRTTIHFAQKGYGAYPITLYDIDRWG